MIDLSWVWLIGLVTTHFLAYLLGRGDGQNAGELSEEARIEIAKYEIDKKYAFDGWLEERSGEHE